jgi:NADH-quinone oxidoreductase subunit N
MTIRPLEGPGESEYVGSLLLTLAGVMLVAATRELVLLFVALELISIPTYIMLYIGRRDRSAQESAAKYFFLSVFSSALLLYGFTFLYGATGSTDLDVIRERLASAGPAHGWIQLAHVALVLIVAGLAFRIAAVPFHFYAPDVYQGTSHANAAFLSVLPKIAGFLALVRVVAVALGETGPYPWRIAVALAIASMTLGNVVALWQNNIRRLMAYSSIAHAGYTLIGLAAYLVTRDDATRFHGLVAVVLYLTVYAVATLGIFAALACLGRGRRQVDSVDELAGLPWTGGWLRPVVAWSLAALLFSLAGLPPLAGFWGKLWIFGSALALSDIALETRRLFQVLAVIGVLNAAIAAAYYLRIIGVMFFRAPSGEPAARDRNGGAVVATVLCAALAIIIGITPGLWISFADSVARPGGVASEGRVENALGQWSPTPRQH